MYIFMYSYITIIIIIIYHLSFVVLLLKGGLLGFGRCRSWCPLGFSTRVSTLPSDAAKQLGVGQVIYGDYT